jgi:hypothetical protein
VKGSSCSICSSVSSLLLLSSSSKLSGGNRSDGAGDSGDGGGDCTRTFLTTFGFWKLVAGGGWFVLESACSWVLKWSAGGSADAISGSGLRSWSTSANRGTAAGGAAGAEGTEALRRNGLLELRDGCCAMAASDTRPAGNRTECLDEETTRLHDWALGC